MILCGYATFKSKDKSKDYFKIIVLREVTDREKEFGNFGMKPVDKFVSKDVFSGLNEGMIGKQVSITWGGDEISPQIIGVDLA